MKYEANTVDEYIEQLPEDRQVPILKLREAVNDNLPEGFLETISYNMIGWVVPHSLYPNGYHCNPSLPLPFINLASQKNSISLYHCGVYAHDSIMNWFIDEYPNHAKRKLDMGKSCIRFKKMDDIPYELIGELCTKMSPHEWINIYEKTVQKN